MALSLPPLNALRAFEAAGRHGSFSRAAEELGVAHSSISRHVRGLEDRLGVQLFREASRGVSLTDQGAAYLTEISPALEAIAEATESVGARPEGVVTISCEPTFAVRWLINRLSEFSALFPEIDLRLEASQEIADVARYEVDLAIRSLRTGWSEAPSELVSNRPLGVFAAPSLLPQPVEDAAELLRHRQFRDRRGDPWREWFLAAGVSADRIPTPGWRMELSLAFESAVEGQGVILTSTELTELDVARGRLIQAHPRLISSGTYNLIAGPGALRRRPVRAFRGWFLDITMGLRGAEAQPNG